MYYACACRPAAREVSTVAAEDGSAAEKPRPISNAGAHSLLLRCATGRRGCPLWAAMPARSSVRRAALRLWAGMQRPSL